MILLDTHAWVWWAAAPTRLSRRARQAITDARSIGVVPITCWEVAMLVAKGRLELDRDVRVWIKQALDLPKVTLLSITADIAVTAAELMDGLHGDPADRLIVATAIELRAVLVTKDLRLRGYRPLASLW